MIRLLGMVLVSALLCVTAGAQERDEDILGKILNEVGFTRSDIGFHPKGYWSRFPLDVPYRLGSFDDLLAEPFKLYDFATVMGNVVETYLDPAFADTNETGLYKLVYNLGVDKKLGGFRSYSANLPGAPISDQPIIAAIEKIYALAGHETELRTFGSRYESVSLADKIGDQTEGLPDTVQVIIAELLVGLADAIHWQQLAFRRCDRADMAEALAIRNLAQTQGDGQRYYHVLDDIAADIDLPSLHYAALKTVAAAEKAERGLTPFMKNAADNVKIIIPTPFGDVVIFSNARGKPNLLTYDASNTLCVIDFGQDSYWTGTPGAAISLTNPISVMIDLGGNDTYGDETGTQPPTSGVGLCGVGVVIDSDGDDRYYGSVYAQGAGLFGVGVLLDRAGNDSYRASESAQGCGYFGIGLCLDATGDDDYYIHGDGQGMGGIGGGVGVLASFDGKDKYTAEPFSEVFNRGDYHSGQVINANNAQGAGMGRRGDGSDGHAWAGGLGALIDIHGDDEYYSGNFTLGIGYWFATGIVVDKNGDDHYKSCYFTQGSGAHFCNGILIDEAGDDYHELFETAGAAFGFGWDYTNAFLINKGGNDKYRAKMISYGLAEIRSNAFMIDIGGDDQYFFDAGGRGIGGATWRADFGKPARMFAYNSYAKSFGGFIDIGGADSYYSVSVKDDTRTLHELARDNSLWFQPARDDSTFGANNYGVGIDIETGTIPELFKWE